MIDICVVGFGALGTLYSLCLELSGLARVTAVCRSNHDIMNDRGVDIDSDAFGKHQRWKPYRSVPSSAEAADRRYTFVICAFKALPDVVSAVDILGPLSYKADAFVLIQNGIGVESALQSQFPNSVIISGCAWVDATLVEGGKKLTQYGNERLTLGFHRPPETLTSQFSEVAAQQSLDLLVQLFVAGRGNVESETDIVTQRWRKLLWNAAYSTISTLTRGTMADILAESHKDQIDRCVSSIMDEVILVAHTNGIERDLLEKDKSSIMAREKGSGFKPSMLVDLEAGRPIEVEVILGEVTRQAASSGVPVPSLEMMYAYLTIIQHKLIKD